LIIQHSQEFSLQLDAVTSVHLSLLAHVVIRMHPIELELMCFHAISDKEYYFFWEHNDLRSGVARAFPLSTTTG
jgi:hypothetical protein